LVPNSVVSVPCAVAQAAVALRHCAVSSDCVGCRRGSVVASCGLLSCTTVSRLLAAALSLTASSLVLLLAPGNAMS